MAATTVLVIVVYVAGAVLALLLGGPGQRLAGLAVLAVTAARLAALRGARQGAGPWS